MASVIICPFTAASHAAPALVLAKQLASLGVSVIYVIPGKKLHEKLLTADDMNNANIQFEVVDIGEEEEDIPNVAAGLRNVIIAESKSSHFSSKLHPIREKIIQLAASAVIPVRCGIVDFMMVLDGILIENIGFPVHGFVPFSAVAFLGLVYWFEGQKENIQLSMQMPGLPPSKVCDYMSGSKMEDSNSPHFIAHQSRTTCFLTKCSGYIINTFDAIDEQALEVLRKFVAVPIFVVGPLLSSRVFRSSDEGYCKQWLDKQSPRSVVYICFGSSFKISEHQMRELASGLESSGHNFLWGLASSKSALELPWLEEFEERNCHKGFVIKGWAPQSMIVAHSSVGCVLTACGWNTVLESLVLGGIPIIAWPLYGDQIVNCRYLVDAGLAEEVEADPENVGLVKKEEVARVVKLIMSGSKAKSMREKASTPRNAAVEAVKKEGSSHLSLQKFIATINS